MSQHIFYDSPARLDPSFILIGFAKFTLTVLPNNSESFLRINEKNIRLER